MNLNMINYVCSISSPPDSKYIAAGGYDHKVIMYDIASKAMIQDFLINMMLMFVPSHFQLIRNT